MYPVTRTGAFHIWLTTPYVGSTGDFSYGIEGFLIRDGKVVHPVNEMNMTGNMNDFWFRLIETGNDPQPGSQWMFPSLLFEKVDLSGI